MELVSHISYVPAEAHLYFPKKFDVKHTEAQRAVFDGNTEFNQDELEQIAKLNTYAEKQKYHFKPLWTDGMKLRFLYANNFKMSKALISIQEHTIWRETKLPVQIDDPLLKFLNSGLLYVHGRDSQFRPIVIMNVSLIDPKKTDVELVIRAMTFWLEYVIQEWMLPGQIENWVFMANMKGVGVATLAAQSMRKLFIYLSDNWKCRLQTLYLLNVVSSMYIPWQVVKPFLDDVTVQKMQFYKTQIPATLLQTANKEQIEEKYGGTAPNCTQFWPPVIPSTNYFVSPDNAKALISKEEYITLYKQGSLTNMRLDKTLLVERGHHRNFTAGMISDQPSQSAQIPVDRSVTSVWNFAEPQTARHFENDRYTFEPATGRNYPDQFIDDFRSQAAAINKARHEKEKEKELEKEDSDEFEEGDYVNYMDEAPKLNQQRNHVKHFEAFFIDRVRQKWMSQSVKY